MASSLQSDISDDKHNVESKHHLILEPNQHINDLVSQFSDAYSVDSSGRGNEHDGAALKLIASTSYHVNKIKSRTSEISRIISGIRDERAQDEVTPYLGTYDADMDIIKHLTRTSSNQASASGVESRHHLSDNASRTHSGISSYDHPIDGNAGATGENKDSSCASDLVIDESVEENLPPKDTGYAWVVAICGLFAVFSTWGANAGYGVFLAYYTTNNTFSGATNYDFALIGGLVVFIAQLFAPICIVLYNIVGPFPTFYLGLAFQFCGFLLASFATKLWQLYLTQGVLIGLSFLFVFLPATLVLPTWFDKHKALAFGILAGGAGLGGVFFALTVNKLIEQTGNQRWALRMVCIVTTVVGVISCSLMRPRGYKPIGTKRLRDKEFIWKNITSTISIQPYIEHKMLGLLVFWYGILLLNYVLVLFLMSSYALSVGLSAKDGTTLTAILNAAQLFGRPTCGHIADRIGRFNYTAITCLALAILVFAYWMKATSFAALLVFNIVFGAIIGVANIMTQPLLRDLLEDEDHYFAPAWSGVNVYSAPFPLVAEVIALAMRNDSSSKPFNHTQIFAGCIYILGFFVILVIKEQAVKKKISKLLVVVEEGLNDKTKGGYLKADTESQQENNQILEERADRYRDLLKSSVKGYLLRVFYLGRI